MLTRRLSRSLPRHLAGRARTLITACCLAAVAALAAVPARAAAQSSLPERLDDTTFWRLVTDVSEPGGYFRSNNFVSNELTYQWVIPELLRTTRPGGVYLGVGPDQNFTYIIALAPRISFIFDIRRQNMLTHLMYKALLEQATDRADFLSHLFARPRPAGLDSTASPRALFTAYAPVRPDTALARATLDGVVDWLTRHHGFTLPDTDVATIRYVYGAFVDAGPDITYDFGQRYGGFGLMPTYAELQMATDSAGTARGYLATEANFRALQADERENRIVPVVGDFAGTHAIRAVGDYVAAHGATVTAFYLSNVEQYLFQQDAEWRSFFENAATLPLDTTSTFIRSSFLGGYAYRYYGRGARSTQLLASMRDQLRAYQTGKILYYEDVLRTSR